MTHIRKGIKICDKDVLSSKYMEIIYVPAWILKLLMDFASIFRIL